MDAREAFEQFEKRGAGIWPVLLLSAVALAATIGVVHWSKSLSAIDDSSQRLVDIGFTLAQALGLDTEFKELDDALVQRHQATLDDQRQQVSQSLPPGSQYVGVFQISRLESIWLQAWLDQQGRYQIEVGPMQTSSKGTYYPVALSSRTADDRWLVTSNESSQWLTPDWQEFQLFAPTDGDVAVWLPKLISMHEQRLTDRPLMSITGDSIKEFNSLRKRREAIWLMQQTPITVEKFQQLLQPHAAELGREETAQILMGFCCGLCKAYDHMAIEAFRNQLTDNAPQAEDERQLVVLHGLTNPMYLQLRLLGPKAQVAQHLPKWTSDLVRDGHTTRQAVDQHLAKLTRQAPLIELGEIQQPFSAKIFRIPPEAWATRFGPNSSDEENR